MVVAPGGARLVTRRSWAALVLLSLAAVSACGGGSNKVKMPALGSAAADEYLFTRGTAALGLKHWYEAHEYFRRLVESYPQSEHRQDAKLGLGDSYIGLKSTASGHPRHQRIPRVPAVLSAQYASRLRALSNLPRRIRMTNNPERDQTGTIEAMKDMDLFLERHKESKYRPEVEKLRRLAQDKLSDHEFLVGIFNYKSHASSGAINRFLYVMQHDPGYGKMDAVYYYYGLTLMDGFHRAPDPAVGAATETMLAKVIDTFRRANTRQWPRRRSPNSR